MDVLTVFWPCDRACHQAVQCWSGGRLYAGLEEIQASHPQATKRCSILLSSATVISLQMLGRNFRSNCCSCSLLSRSENGMSKTGERALLEAPRLVICCARKEGGGPALGCLCKASPPGLAFTAECLSQTCWRSGLSVLDLVCPTHLKHRECFSPVILQRGTLTAYLSAACSRHQRLSSHSTEATVVSQKGLQGKKKGSRRDGEKGKWERHAHFKKLDPNQPGSPIPRNQGFEMRNVFRISNLKYKQ